ncbi:hypothetical protein CPB86DRAFT_326488 [Serendipita vermifera]|nr:hypothetical protein CPB86DRAFT_326488 [Serendipita vermifera]
MTAPVAGYYNIVNIAQNQYLALGNEAQLKDQTPLTCKSPLGEQSQHWKLVYLEGTSILVMKDDKTKLYCRVKDSKTEPSVLLVSSAKKSPFWLQSHPSGYYRIKVPNRNLAVTLSEDSCGPKVNLSEGQEAKEQLWKFVFLGPMLSGVYTITEPSSGCSLDLSNASATDQTPIIGYRLNRRFGRHGSSNQQVNIRSSYRCED